MRPTALALALVALVAAPAFAEKVERAERVPLKAEYANNPRIKTGIERAQAEQDGLKGGGKGVFAGVHPVTREPRILHLELVEERTMPGNEGFLLRAHHISLDGGATEHTEHFFRPVGQNESGSERFFKALDLGDDSSISLLQGRGFRHPVIKDHFEDNPEGGR